jgi:hypothetical protein
VKSANPTTRQALGLKCSGQKVQEAIDQNLLNRYTDVWEWRGGWPPVGPLYKLRIQVTHSLKAPGFPTLEPVK